MRPRLLFKTERNQNVFWKVLIRSMFSETVMRFPFLPPFFSLEMYEAAPWTGEGQGIFCCDFVKA